MLLVLLLVATGLGIARYLEGVHREAKRPKLRELNSQKSSWRGESWQAFAKIEGEPPFSYQWYEGYPGDVTAPVANATTASLRLASLQKSNRYWLRVTNGYGILDTQGVSVEVHTLDVVDHRAELDELLSFARRVLEQCDNLKTIADEFTSLVTLSNEERKTYSDIRDNSTRKAHEAAVLLVNKLMRLRSNANQETINELFASTRPALLPADSFEGARLRKSFDLVEALWRMVRHGDTITEKEVFELAYEKVPL